MARRAGLTARRGARRRRLLGAAFGTVLVLAIGAVASWRLGLFDELGAGHPPAESEPAPLAAPSPSPTPSDPFPSPEPINTAFEGLTTFRGNATRTYYGEGPVPEAPGVLWRYPVSGGLCSRSSDEEGTRVWCGTGWTGQPNVVEAEDEAIEVRFGAYDGAVHILDGRTGESLMEEFQTGDLIKGTMSSDPDGFPLLYVGSRDNYFRILALDRGSQPVELWSLSADSAPNPVWNNDWDGSPLVIDDHVLLGGENSWFYVIELHREYGEEGLVSVAPEIRMLVPGYDDELLSALDDNEVSIENSVAYHRGVAYFANSGGLVQGWRVSKVLRGKDRFERVFRFWAGEDIDASVVIDEEGFLYVAAEQERFNARGEEVGQVLKLDPARPKHPVVWSISVPGEGGDGGVWATPALYRRAVFVTTNTGRLLAVDRRSGEIAWELELPAPLWSSPVVVDGTLIVGDCAGVLHAYTLRAPLQGPPDERWSVQLEGCIESTPAVWRGMIYLGTRGGAVYGIGDP